MTIMQDQKSSPLSGDGVEELESEAMMTSSLEPGSPLEQEGQVLAVDNQVKDSPGFPSYGVRTGQGGEFLGIYNRDSGFEMTGGTWILSSNNEILGGPLPAATGFDLTCPPCRPPGPTHTSTPKKSSTAGNEGGWLHYDYPRDPIDYIAELPRSAREFQPEFNSTFEMTDSPSMSVEEGDSAVVVSEPESPRLFRPRQFLVSRSALSRRLLGQSNKKARTETAVPETFHVTKMVEEFTQLFKDVKKNGPDNLTSDANDEGAESHFQNS